MPPSPQHCGGSILGCISALLAAGVCFVCSRLPDFIADVFSPVLGLWDRCLLRKKSLYCRFNLGGNGEVPVLAHTMPLGLSFQGSDLSNVMSAGKALPRSTPCRSTPGCTQASGPTPAPCAARLSPPSTHCWST